MQRNPAYRQVYRFWQDLRRQPFLTVESPLFQIPLHELPHLYECWCAVQLVATLLELPDVQVEAQSLVSGPDMPGSGSQTTRATSSSLYRLTLTEEQPLLLLAWRGMSLQLRYQPRYRPATARRTQHADAITHLISLDRHTRIPDFVLELEQPDGAPAIAVLDAKYRLDAGGGAPEDALADAYSYLGSIGTPAGERVARAAMLLYPGTGSAEQYASAAGAIPLLPGATAALQTWLEQLWSDDPA
jgi:large subunit ribosomal protein MRP49